MEKSEVHLTWISQLRGGATLLACSPDILMMNLNIIDPGASLIFSSGRRAENDVVVFTLLDLHLDKAIIQGLHHVIHTDSNACLRSTIRSSASSIPTE